MNYSDFIYSKIILALFAIHTSYAFACPSGEYEVCAGVCICVPNSGKALDLPGTTVRNVSREAEKGIRDVAATVEKALKDTAATIDKAGKDTSAELGRIGKNLDEAAQAIGTFIEREFQGLGKSLSSAEKRFREGKVIDALWHLAIDRIQITEEAASEAALKSDYLRTVGQVAATAYGGPSGAAAYATWLTFRQTGDAELALRVGIITGASSAAYSYAGKLPSGDAYQIAKKTVVTGAIGGLAIAAAGGNDVAVQEAFLKAGAMVVIQDGYKRFTGHYLEEDNLKSSKGDAYCTTANTDCSFPNEAVLERDKDGNATKVDMSKVDPRKPHVGLMSPKNENVTWVGTGEDSVMMKSVSKVPGMNAMSVFHDQWAISWDMDSLTTKATIIPAIVLTYVGTGAPYYEHLRETAVESSLKQDSDKELPGNIAEKPDSKSTVLVKKDDLQTVFMCASEKEHRTILVERSDNDKKYACRVYYTKNADSRLAWSASNERDFCTSKAEGLATILVSGGFGCHIGTKPVLKQL